jgi:hypothetical protein
MVRLLGGIGLAAVLVCVLVGCGSAGSEALYSTTKPWGSATHTDPVGQMWAATGIPICTKGNSSLTVTSIEPIAVSGQIHLDRILIQPGHWGELAFYRGAPPGSRPATGFVVPSPSPCAGPPRYQAIVLAHRTGPQGGSVDGLSVQYRAGNARGVYTIHFTDLLCGKHGPPGPCQDR